MQAQYERSWGGGGLENSLQKEQARLGQLGCLVFLLSVDVDFPHLREQTPSSFYLTSFLHQLLSDHWFVPIQGKPGVRGLPGPRGLPGLEVSLWGATYNRTIRTHPRQAALHKASLSCCFASAFYQFPCWSQYYLISGGWGPDWTIRPFRTWGE